MLVANFPRPTDLFQHLYMERGGGSRGQFAQFFIRFLFPKKTGKNILKTVNINTFGERNRLFYLLIVRFIIVAFLWLVLLFIDFILAYQTQLEVAKITKRQAKLI